MDLFQLLHKSIPQKKSIFSLLHIQEKKDVSKFLLKIIKKMRKEIKDIRMINLFCIELYDILYYYIMFDKIRVIKKLLRLLETLALPIHYTDKGKRTETLKKTCKIKI